MGFFSSLLSGWGGLAPPAERLGARGTLRFDVGPAFRPAFRPAFPPAFLTAGFGGCFAPAFGVAAVGRADFGFGFVFGFDGAP